MCKPEMVELSNIVRNETNGLQLMSFHGAYEDFMLSILDSETVPN